MSEALALARRLAARSRAVAAPNPWVGAVVSVGSDVVGVGRTAAPGGDHAEVAALRAAGDRARGATLSVTLEPCAHHGRTPPCVDAIIAAGIRRVEVGLVDPDERVSGRGLRALRAAGIEVELAPRVQRAAILEELAPYVSHRLRLRPWVIGKVAMTLDGAVSDAAGRSKWITGERARDEGHRLRARVDAIVVGRRTYEVDRPELTARPGGRRATRQPQRVVASRGGSVEVRSGFEVSELPPRAFLEEAARRGWVAVLVEGGPTLLGAYLDAEVVDELLVGIAPAVLGDSRAVRAFTLGRPRSLDDALRGRWLKVERAEPDLVGWLRLPAGEELFARYWAFEQQVTRATFPG